MSSLDRRALARDLRAALEGEVRFDTATRALYATDASNYRQPPIGVVIPRTLDDVVATHGVCRDHGAPIVPRGCGTSLSGETVNVAVVIDCSKHLDAIGDVDADARTVTAQCGAINAKVNEQARRHGLVFGPDPSTHAYCTIGGNVGNNSCGPHSVQAIFQGDGGRTSDNVRALDVVTYGGTRLRVERGAIHGPGAAELTRKLLDLRDRYALLIRERFVDIPRRVSGYNLDELLPEKGFDVARALVGTEGTCVTVLEATLALVPDPPARAGVVLGYADICEAGDHVLEALAHRPLAVEGFDDLLVELEREGHMEIPALERLPRGRGWMYVELGGATKDEAVERARALLDDLGGDCVGTRLVDDDEHRAQLTSLREAGLPAAAFPHGEDHWPGWEDSAVAPERIGDYLRDLQALCRRHGYWGTFYGHLGQGCMHVRLDFDLRTQAGIARYRAFVEEAADLVVSYGGSLSGEHGDGQARGELLEKMYGPELVQAFREFKRIWDPEWKMNPGKVVDAAPLDEHLKLHGFPAWRPSVRFGYPEDRGDFAHATIRCVGVGKCRNPNGVDVMCPSFVATKDEMHTTRGRARLLFEMLDGGIVEDRWRSREVLEALDLCLACKGCTHDCPVHVDMPTYKAEFLHHHWRGRLRPRQAYAFGLIDVAARAGSLAPRAANVVTRTRLAKLAAGIAPERDVPPFAPLSLQAWFRRRRPRNPFGPKLVLWPDTFTNRFHPEIGVAAVEALEAAGWRVLMPTEHVCCGRPLYDYGFLGLAERYLRRTLRQLARYGDVPVVGLEPSCVATLKDELPKLLPDEADLAARTFHLAEFWRRFSLEPPLVEPGRALLWGHCHQKATGGVGPDEELLRACGLEVEHVTGGCCGLAGSWGFERGHHALSLEIGEHALLPAVRAAPESTRVVANGFSCRTQIAEATGRHALHLAELLAGAREHPRPAPAFAVSRAR
jgi:FAD/FMN-containing dehydrogenase/Fe-S oxidoreductase